MNKIIAVFITLLTVLSLHAKDLKIIKPRLGSTYDPVRDQMINEKYIEISKKLETISYDQLTKEEQSIIGEAEEGEGCDWYCGGGPKEISASSTLPDQGPNSYAAKNIHDFNHSTAWVEGKNDYGIGEKIHFTFGGKSPRVTSLEIYNGYQKSKSAWMANSRVKTLRLYIDGIAIADLALQDIRTSQIFETGVLWEHRESDHILTLEIRAVYPGTKWPDTCISDIRFDGLDVHCFPVDTRILMSNGTEKNIQDIEIGDEIMSYNAQQQKMEMAVVEQTTEVIHHNLVEITLSDGSQIISTDDHPYLSPEGWIAQDPKKAMQYKLDAVGSLIPGSTIMSFTGNTINFLQVTGIRHLTGHRMTYGIIKTSRNDNYIANGFIVNTEILK